MFLSVKQPACGQILQEMLETVETILSYSVQTLTQTLDLSALSQQINTPFRPLLQRRKIRKILTDLFALSYLQRLELYEAFLNDEAFAQHIDDEKYHFSKLPSPGEQVLKSLCNSLYDIVRSGLSADNQELFSVNLLQKQYVSANGTMGRVCPVCVRELLFDIGEGEVDHYFPRTRRPALALHPANLLPTCPDCNGVRFKHSKDPIDQNDSGPGELRTVFLPYLRPAWKEVRLDVGESCEIVLRPGAQADAYTQKRIDNLERLYQLGARWSGVLSHTYDNIMEEIKTRIDPHQTMRQQLASLRALLHANAESTKDRPDFVKGIYCTWLLEKSDAELAEIFLKAGPSCP